MSARDVIVNLKELAGRTSDANGAQRVAWGPVWREARRWLDGELADLGLHAEIDAAGNRWITLPGTSARTVIIGGHLDSVPNGGWLDGPLGVLAGVEALCRFKDTRPPVTLAVVFAFLLLLVAGVVIATRARDRFGKLLGFGIVALLTLQAILNMGVTTMVLPNKGLPLPFISYGGSNLAFCLITIGILISIYRNGFGEEKNPEAAFLAVKTKRRKSPRM